jgi:SAM-dependent methyltransferase
MVDEEAVREAAREVAEKFLERGDFTGWFDALYASANGDTDLIPWADLEPNRFFVEWDKTAKIDGNGKRALVVGCGLGDEAKYLRERGFDVTAFDISHRAIDWARRVHNGSEIDFHVADLFEAPKDWSCAFDLVVEVYTVQALPAQLREKSIKAICGFVKTGGELVVVQRFHEGEEKPDGPPWALSEKDLSLFETGGLERSEFHEYLGDEEEPIKRFVAVFVRPVAEPQS